MAKVGHIKDDIVIRIPDDIGIQYVFPELSSILDYVAELKELDVSDIPATSHPFEAENVTRKDWERISDSKSQATKKIIDLAPETKESYFKVKSILK